MTLKESNLLFSAWNSLMGRLVYDDESDTVFDMKSMTMPGGGEPGFHKVVFGIKFESQHSRGRAEFECLIAFDYDECLLIIKNDFPSCLTTDFLRVFDIAPYVNARLYPSRFPAGTRFKEERTGIHRGTSALLPGCLVDIVCEYAVDLSWLSLVIRS